MKKHILPVFFTALCGLLTACGVKGPLYYPVQETQQTQPQQEQQEQQNNQTQQK